MPESTRSVAKAPSPSAEVYDRLRQIEMDAQRDCSDLSSHEDICAERYAGIEKALAEIKGSVTSLSSKVDLVALAQITAAGKAEGAAEARRPKWWVTPVVSLAAVCLGAFFAGTGFLISRVISDNDQRVATLAAKQNGATVNVNPTGAPSPQTYQVVPPAPAQPVPEPPG